MKLVGIIFSFFNAREKRINQEDEDLYDVDLEYPFNSKENEEEITLQYLNEGCHIHSSYWKDPPSEKIFIRFSRHGMPGILSRKKDFLHIVLVPYSIEAIIPNSSLHH